MHLGQENQPHPKKSLKIALAQINPIVGDIEGNLQKCLNAISEAEKEKMDVVVLPELITTGYPPRDLLNRADFIKANLKSKDSLVEYTSTLKVAVVFGYVHPNDKDGKPNFNAVCVAQNGRDIYHRFKTLLPTYDVFEEDIYFEPGSQTEQNLGTFKINDVEIGCVICEEAWNDKEYWSKRLYEFDPVKQMIRYNKNIDGIISVNASPYRRGVNETRHEMIAKICKDNRIFFAYCNMVGYNDDVGFDGNSFARDKNGGLLASALPFTEDFITFDIDAPDLPYAGEDVLELDTLRALKLGISDYFDKTGIKGPAIIGLSGGIDSALVAYLATAALGPNRVIGVGMPSEFSSDHSKSDAAKLAKKLGIRYVEMPIAEQHDSIRAAFDLGVPKISQNFVACKDSGVTDENLQARIRGIYLMAISNFHNGLVLSTGNKSEMAVGYCVDGDSLIATSKGIITAKNLFSGLKKGNTYLTKGNEFIDGFQSNKNKLVSFVTKLGNRIVVSEDHDVKVYDKVSKSVSFKKAGNLDIGDIVIQKIGDNIWGNDTIIEPFIYAKKEWDFRSFDFNLPYQITEDMAKFLGICVADGSYCGNGLYKIRLAKDEVKDFTLPYLASIGLPSSCYKATEKDENGCYFIEISSVQFVAWLRHIGVRHGAGNKTIPDIILKSPKNIVIHFLSGAMMDSTTDLKEKHGEITYHSISKGLAEYAHFCMLNLGIMCYIRHWNRPKQNNILHEVYIPASETYKLSEFSFLKNSIKERIKNNSEANRKKHKSFADDLYGYETYVDSVCEMLSWDKRRTLKQNIAKRGCIGRKTLKSYLELIPDSEAKTVLKSAIESSVYYVPISSIDFISEDKEMFDFSMLMEKEYTVNTVVVHNCTLYGDMCGGLAVISDVKKTLVFSLCEFINAMHRDEIIPWNTIRKPPSAELRPNQTDQQSLPPYVLLDAVMERYVEQYQSPAEIKKELAGEQETMQYLKENNRILSDDIDKVCRLIRNNQYKRVQSPTGLKVTSRLFKMGYRMPIARKWD